MPNMSGEAYRYAACAHYRLGNLQRSAQLFDEAFRRNPNLITDGGKYAAKAHAKNNNFTRVAEITEELFNIASK